MKLTGECNCCGACCFSKSGAVCENLEVLTRQGLPNGTKCRVYAERYDGLPIRMITKDGRILYGYYCAKNSAAEVKSIIEMGIKKGVCSLSVGPDIPVPSANSPKPSERARRRKAGDGGEVRVRGGQALLQRSPEK